MLRALGLRYREIGELTGELLDAAPGAALH
jgi:hypothetical protein